MLDSGPLAAVGWLVFVLGLGIIGLATLSRGARLKSHARRAADALTGSALCFLALALIVTGAGRNVTYGLLGATVLAIFASWYIGRHARQIDRATKRVKGKR